MRFRRSLAVVVGVSALLIGTAVNASATTPISTRNAPFFGDLNGDGIPDRVTLGSTSSSCYAKVERGQANGTFGSPVVHKFALPDALYSYCPDLGAVGSFTSWNAHELVVAWFNGSPLSSGAGLAVLHNFVEVAEGPGEDTPSVIGVQDFNGDGRSDVWESTEQAQGFSTYLWKSSTSTLVAGAAKLNSLESVPSLVFADLNHTGVLQVLVGYHVGTAPGGTADVGTARASILDSKSGVETVLADDPTGHLSYTVTPIGGTGLYTNVIVAASDGTSEIFVNRGHGQFTPAGQRPMAGVKLVRILPRPQPAPHHR